MPPTIIQEDVDTPTTSARVSNCSNDSGQTNKDSITSRTSNGLSERLEALDKRKSFFVGKSRKSVAGLANKWLVKRQEKGANTSTTVTTSTRKKDRDSSFSLNTEPQKDYDVDEIINELTREHEIHLNRKDQINNASTLPTDGRSQDGMSSLSEGGWNFSTSSKSSATKETTEYSPKTPVFKRFDFLPYEIGELSEEHRFRGKSIFSNQRNISQTTVGSFLCKATEPKEPRDQTERIRQAAPRKWENVVPLATPRNKKVPLCEICSSRARVMCSHCRVTFYCNEEHFFVDEFHSKCCFLLQVVRTPPRIFPTKREREKIEKDLLVKKNELVNRVTTVGIMSLSTEKFEMANASFNQAICYGKTLLGEKSLHVAKLFMLKAECSLQLGSVTDAEKEMAAGEIVYDEHLNDNHWLELKAEDNKIIAFSAELAKVQALCHMARKQWDLSLFFISEGIYQYSRLYGPDSMKSARCYFLMGEIFFRKRQYTVSETLFVHSLQNYTDWLVIVFEDNYLSGRQQTIFDRLVTSATENPDLIKEVELPIKIEGEIIIHLKKLHQIFRYRKDFIYGKCLVAFGILAFLKGMVKHSEAFMSCALPFIDGKRDRMLREICTNIHRRTRRVLARALRAGSVWGPSRLKNSLTQKAMMSAMLVKAQAKE